MKKVKDIMTSPVTACTPSTTIHDAEDLMTVKKVSALPVVERNGDDVTIKGILTLHDLTGFEDDEVSVLQAMTGGVEVIRAEASVQEAAQKMVDKKIHHLIVVNEDGEITGMLSSFDFVRMVAGQ